MNMERITNKDLKHQNYDMDILKQNIDSLDMKTILHTQRLDAAFCVDYLLNEDYMECVEDTYYFTLCKVLLYQKHITEGEIMEYAEKKNRKYTEHGA